MGGNQEAYSLYRDTGFLSGRDLAHAVAAGQNVDEFYAEQRKREANDPRYQAVRVGYAESDVLRCELALQKAQKEVVEARNKLRERKAQYEAKFGKYERTEDTAKSLRIIKARHLGADPYEMERVVTNHPDDQESLEELYGPAGA